MSQKIDLSLNSLFLFSVFWMLSIFGLFVSVLIWLAVLIKKVYQKLPPCGLKQLGCFKGIVQILWSQMYMYLYPVSRIRLCVVDFLPPGACLEYPGIYRCRSIGSKYSFVIMRKFLSIEIGMSKKITELLRSSIFHFRLQCLSSLVLKFSKFLAFTYGFNMTSISSMEHTLEIILCLNFLVG